jgi:UDP-N-acetylglucosamine--N-acetylmuramyl-(pentapeptide) pyrophosphoryl-undecaprenol N-acetylglucosamine transferase
MKTNAAQGKTLMIMAAGTGGHIFPGIAIAETMRARGWNVSWLGTAKGMEAQIVPKHNIEMDNIDFSGLRGKGILHTVTGAFKLLSSFITCFGIVGKRKPDVVLGMGGYVTVPGGMMAALRGTPVVLMNADAGLLLSNKVLSPFANKLLFGLPSLLANRSRKVAVTGNPIRQDICQLAPPKIRYATRTGVLNILVVGGSLGAKVLNETIPAALALIPVELRPTVTHQSGKLQADALRQCYTKLGIDVEVVEFIDDMPNRYAQADLVICRAGAITVSELTAAGVANILIPFVASSTSHQADNALWMEKEKAGIYLPQAKLTASSLAQTLQAMSRAQCLEMAQIAYALGKRDANETIATILEQQT